jgi:hypothetical protein
MSPARSSRYSGQQVKDMKGAPQSGNPNKIANMMANQIIISFLNLPVGPCSPYRRTFRAQNHCHLKNTIQTAKEPFIRQAGLRYEIKKANMITTK